MESLPSALVLCWSAWTLRVECPFCLNFHDHELGALPRFNQRRFARCNPNFRHGSYRVLYPDEAANSTVSFGWELNKEKNLIYATTCQGRLRDPLLHNIPTRRLLDRHQDPAVEDEGAITESLNMLTLSDSDKSDSQSTGKSHLCSACKDNQILREKLYISACRSKDITQLNSLFRDFPECSFASIFDHEGSNGILLAATGEAGVETVKRLRQIGVCIDHMNHYGRTAVMEAALWGRLDIFQFLIGKGASLCAKDANGHCAVDFAVECERNEEERISRSEVTVRADAYKNRRQMLFECLMRGEKIEEVSTSGQNLLSKHPGLFRKLEPNLLLYYTPDTSYAVPPGKESKAFGRLDRGTGYPVISAMSGYSQGSETNVLDNRKWTKKAQELCRIIDFDDNLSYASHVEKQLIAYYMDKHWIFEEDACSSPDAKYIWSHDRSLRDVLPRPPPATITVSKSEMCWNCSSFFEQFSKRFGDDKIDILPTIQ
ncbi:hypothetical protein VTL71DRAFT_20 [Oculimacula yallundae]|uniref:Ankyrin repeat protein n=1 Tax=Oculimacula yallundae TaxID=86028 RepID=A0ABR4CYS6_9HELO